MGSSMLVDFGEDSSVAVRASWHTDVPAGSFMLTQPLTNKKRTGILSSPPGKPSTWTTQPGRHLGMMVAPLDRCRKVERGYHAQAQANSLLARPRNPLRRGSRIRAVGHGVCSRYSNPITGNRTWAIGQLLRQRLYRPRSVHVRLRGLRPTATICIYKSHRGGIGHSLD